MKLSTVMIRSCIIGEMILLAFFYFFGSQGLLALKKVEALNFELEKEIAQLTEQTRRLHISLLDWQNYPFYKEKFIREQLYMSKPGEEIYLY